MIGQVVCQKLLRDALKEKAKYQVNSWRWLSWCYTIHSYVLKLKELKRYKICWQSTITNYSGEGSPTTKEAAKSWVEYGNKEFPEIKHWVEEV